MRDLLEILESKLYVQQAKKQGCAERIEWEVAVAEETEQQIERHQRKREHSFLEKQLPDVSGADWDHILDYIMERQYLACNGSVDPLE